MTSPESTTGELERIARIIDPRLADSAWIDSFGELPGLGDETCFEYVRRVALAKADAILALSTPSVGVPEGWKMVPVEPAPEMLRAGNNPLGCRRECHLGEHRAREAWTTMLAAAPTHPALVVDRGGEDQGVSQDPVIDQCGSRDDLADSVAATLAFDLLSVRDWLLGLPALDMEDIAADGGVTVAMVVQQESREMAGRVRRIMDALSTPTPPASTTLATGNEEVADIPAGELAMRAALSPPAGGKVALVEGLKRARKLIGDAYGARTREARNIVLSAAAEAIEAIIPLAPASDEVA